MAHGEAEHGRARGEQSPLRGDQDEQSTAFTGKPLRWVCGAVPAGAEMVPGATGSGGTGSGSAAARSFRSGRGGTGTVGGRRVGRGG